MDPWKGFELEVEGTHLWEMGEARAWLRAREGELAVAMIREGELLDRKEEDLEWKRWTGIEKIGTVRMVPTLPDRSLVLRPTSNVMVSPNRTVALFAALPMDVKMLLEGDQELDLWTEHTQVVSNTWFGDTAEGELCYSVPWVEALTVADLPGKPNRIICPVSIKNTSKDVLTVQRFCLRVEHLRLYQGGGRLWSNEVTVTFVGGEKVSDVRYGTQKPKVGTELTLLSDARVPPSRGNKKRSFFDPDNIRQYF